jgi:MerR family transcriptional regulator, redox-sensitive transcriptional activator SoxR
MYLHNPSRLITNDSIDNQALKKAIQTAILITSGNCLKISLSILFTSSKDVADYWRER